MVRLKAAGSWRRSMTPIWAVIGLSAACTFPEKQLSSGERHLVIHAVLDPGTRVQRIVIRYSDTGNGAGIAITGVQAAITTPDGIQMIATPDSVVPFMSGKPVPSGDYRVSLDAYGVSLIPGGTYSLRVRTPAGDDATGTTTIPLASAKAFPAATEPFLRLRDTLRLDWPRVAGAASFEVRIARIYAVNSAGFQNPANEKYVAFAAAKLSITGTAHSVMDDGSLFEPNAETTVLVSAVDANYYEYYRVLSDPFTPAAPSHLTGAVGLFGSIVPIVARRLDVR